MALASGLPLLYALSVAGVPVTNDRYGHPVGDALLQAVASRLNGILRDGDFAVHMGGDEVVVVQASVGNREEAMLLGRRIIRTLSEPFVLGGVELVVSVGIVIGREGEDPELLTPAADKALYACKACGRNGDVRPAGGHRSGRHDRLTDAITDDPHMEMARSDFDSEP